MTLQCEELYHLVDLLEMYIKEVKQNKVMPENLKEASIKYNLNLIEKLKSELSFKGCE